MVNVQESRERFKKATENMDYDRAVVLGGIFGELTHEVERLQKVEMELRAVIQLESWRAKDDAQ